MLFLVFVLRSLRASPLINPVLMPAVGGKRSNVNSERFQSA